MMARLICVLAVLVACVAPARVEEERSGKRGEDARKDMQELQGTWQLESIEDGKKAKIDTKKRTLFVGADLFIVREGGKVVQAGQLRLVTTKSPRTIDVTVRKGENEDTTMLGVYQLKGDTLEVCFDPEGESRPKKFEAKKDSPVYVATYKRVKRQDEGTDIVGRYTSETFGLDNKKASMKAEIERRGDAYLVRWEVPGGVAFIGTGIRKGKSLSVAWVNRGSAGVTVFEIEKGPKLVGTYTDVGGAGLVSREVLTPSKENLLEVRLR